MFMALLAAPVSTLAQQVGPPAPAPVPSPPPASTAIVEGDDTAVGPLEPRPGQQNCRRTPSENGEIVVCGQGNSENSTFRIPRQFRGQVSHDDADASLAARTRDMDSIERFANQTSGPSAYLNRSAQQRCEWVAERQIAQGRRPDCTRRNRQNEAQDYTRGIPPARE